MKKSINVSLLSDSMFKLFFKINKKYLAFIINNICNLDIEEESIEFVDKEILNTTVDGKKSLLDLKVKLKTGDIVFIEMQSYREKHISERIEYYNSKVMGEQLIIGDRYDKLKKVFSITFINFEDFEYDELFTKYTDYDNINSRNGKVLREKNIINLTYLSKNKTFDEKMMKFLLFMTLKSESEMEEMALEDNEIKEVVESVKSITRDPIQSEYLWTKQKEEMVHQVHLTEAKEEGIEQGTVKTKNELIINMHNNGLDINMISNISEFSVEEVERIINENENK